MKEDLKMSEKKVWKEPEVKVIEIEETGGAFTGADGDGHGVIPS